MKLAIIILYYTGPQYIAYKFVQLIAWRREGAEENVPRASAYKMPKEYVLVPSVSSGRITAINTLPCAVPSPLRGSGILVCPVFLST